MNEFIYISVIYIMIKKNRRNLKIKSLPSLRLDLISDKGGIFQNLFGLGQKKMEMNRI